MCPTSLVGAGVACRGGLSFRGGNAPHTRWRASLHSICIAVANVGMLCFAEGGTEGPRRANVLRKSNTAMNDSSPRVGNLVLSRLWRSREQRKSFAVAARTRMDLSAVSFAVMAAPTYYRIVAVGPPSASSERRQTPALLPRGNQSPSVLPLPRVGNPHWCSRPQEARGSTAGEAVATLSSQAPPALQRLPKPPVDSQRRA